MKKKLTLTAVVVFVVALTFQIGLIAYMPKEEVIGVYQLKKDIEADGILEDRDYERVWIRVSKSVSLNAFMKENPGGKILKYSLPNGAILNKTDFKKGNYTKPQHSMVLSLDLENIHMGAYKPGEAFTAIIQLDSNTRLLKKFIFLDCVYSGGSDLNAGKSYVTIKGTEEDLCQLFDASQRGAVRFLKNVSP